MPAPALSAAFRSAHPARRLQQQPVHGTNWRQQQQGSCEFQPPDAAPWGELQNTGGYVRHAGDLPARPHAALPRHRAVEQQE